MASLGAGPEKPSDRLESRKLQGTKGTGLQMQILDQENVNWTEDRIRPSLDHAILEASRQQGTGEGH